MGHAANCSLQSQPWYRLIFLLLSPFIPSVLPRFHPRAIFPPCLPSCPSSAPHLLLLFPATSILEGNRGFVRCQPCSPRPPHPQLGRDPQML